ncbi:MAG TPA: acyl-CoA dehydrogenase family protein [Trebonia sp.]|nr:acyl-CoA dehydrogenase family protein [Trebonia sp.]
MTPEEAAAFSESVAGLSARHWGRAADAGAADAAGPRLGGLWAAGAGQGWFALGQDDALDAALAAARELGRVACPLPVMDAFAAVRVLSGEEKIAAQVASGEMRVLVASDCADKPRYLDAGPAASHVLTLPRGAGLATLRPVIACREMPGLAVPAWSTVELGSAEAQAEIAAAQADAAATLMRLGLAARALAAAQRAHEMAVEHAKSRRQFGTVIGSFGAVQQRAAACQIDVSAGRHLLDRAEGAYTAGREDWPLQAQIAVEFIAATARRVQLGAHHTLAATGYFEEHDAPWLFRRVHADIARLATFPPRAGTVADVLVETPASLPAFDLGPVGESFRGEVRAFLAARADRHGQFDEGTLVPAMAERRWFGFGWPAAHGGRNASLAEQVVLHEEITYARAPVTTQLSSVVLLGNSILRHGTTEQRAAFLPLIRAGQLRFCLGYSEPEAGSDLASLKTCAERAGGDWVINGQKIWTTGGHRASHVWLATRTDPAASPRHAGITVFLVPMDTPGITIKEHRALSGEISCTVFYDDVRVPDSARVGEVNGGWKVITDALAGERVVMGGIAASMLRQLDDLLAAVRPDPGARVGPRGSAARAKLGELAVTLQANRALVATAIGATAAGGGARFEAPMAGVLGGELAEAFGEGLLDILGPRGALSGPGAPGGGAFEYGLRLSIMYVVGGGTNDIQRGLIARGMGLPR